MARCAATSQMTPTRRCVTSSLLSQGSLSVGAARSSGHRQRQAEQRRGKDSCRDHVPTISRRRSSAVFGRVCHTACVATVGRRPCVTAVDRAVRHCGVAAVARSRVTAVHGRSVAAAVCRCGICGIARSCITAAPRRGGVAAVCRCSICAVSGWRGVVSAAADNRRAREGAEGQKLARSEYWKSSHKTSNLSEHRKAMGAYASRVPRLAPR